jgi:hypothetical protein
MLKVPRAEVNATYPNDKVLNDLLCLYQNKSRGEFNNKIADKEEQSP